MSFDYSELRSEASSLIGEFGRDIVVKLPSKSGEAWNPETVWTLTTAKAVAIPASRAIPQIDSEKEGTLIKQTDIGYILESAATITVACRIIDGDDELQVVATQPLKPGDTLMLTRVIARK